MAQVELFARTEIGCARERNEDSFLVLDLATQVDGGLHPEQRVTQLGPPGTLLAVCDGMGGAAAGDVASRLAAEGLARVVRNGAPFSNTDHAERILLRAVGEINQQILAYAGQRPDRHGMGTTLCAAMAFGPRLVVVQIGDSRAYLRRGRVLKQLTTDQSVVGQMVASGQLTEEEARTYDQRNVLLQALGVQPVVSPEILNVDVMAGDVLLLCSDGLTGPLTNDQVLDIMLRYEDPMRCCRALTEAACALGGPDNVTVAVARFIGDGLPAVMGRTPINVMRREETV